MSGGNVDPTLRALGGRSRYQLLQVLVINMGVWGAAFQLLDNIFIGRKVTGYRCARPSSSSEHTRIAANLQDYPANWSSSHVTFGHCEITVHKDNHEASSTYPCLFGYDYDYPRELSFRAEFDLVCGHALLADFLQTLVIMGQGCGAICASVLSDRYGRKRVLVSSQLGLMTVGLAIGLAPTYRTLAFLKFLVGCLQQGVVTAKVTMSLELFPTEYRSLTALVMSIMWLVGTSMMALLSYLMQTNSWRSLQCLLSAISLLAVLQMWYLDESLRWLVANGRKEAAVRVMERAARVNGKDVSTVLHSLYTASSETSGDSERDSVLCDSIDEIRKRNAAMNGEYEIVTEGTMAEDGVPFLDSCDQVGTGIPVKPKQAQGRMTILDLFRHKRLCFKTLVVWITWFTCAFCTFTLYLMSTSLHGNPFLNFFLTVLTELPASLLFFYLVDRAGRKPAVQLFFLLSGAGLTANGFFRLFEGNWVFGVMSVVSAMVGMMGATGIFGAMFFYTPELYPTNIRQQALGFASFAGRCGGMIAPFMVPLSEVIVWLPGALTGTLCFTVVFLFRFLPETQGRELPQTLEDIDAWDLSEDQSLCSVSASGYLRKWVRIGKKLIRCCVFQAVGSSRSISTEKSCGVNKTSVL